MADKVSERVGNLSAGEYDEKPEGASGALTGLFGLFLGLANNYSVHFVFLLSFLALKVLKGDNNVPLNLFLYFFFFALGSVAFLFFSPLLSLLTVVGYLFEALFYLFAVLAVNAMEDNPGRNMFTAAVTLLGLTHGVNKAAGNALVEATPFGSGRVVDFGLLVSGVLPLFFYVVFKFGVADGDEFKVDDLKLFYTTVTSLGLVVSVLTGLLALAYTSSGNVKRYLEKKRLEHDSKPKFVARHAGALFNNLLVGALVFLALFFTKYTLFPTFFPLDATKKVASGYKYLFLTLPGLLDGLSRVSFVYLFNRVDWSNVSPWKNLYTFVFDLLLVVYFAVLHNLQDQDFVLFEETFALLFFLAFVLVHAAATDVVTLQFLAFRDDKDHDKRDLETPSASAESGLPRSHKRVTTRVFLDVLESVGSTLGSLLTLLLFNLQPDRK